MQIIGITGRSGCGKSTLTDSIRAAGFRCVDADQVAREVLLPGSPCIVQLQQEFGADIVDEAGQARRRLDAQLPENVLRAAADFVIENDGTLQQMQQRCNALLTALRKEAYGETSDEK